MLYLVKVISSGVFFSFLKKNKKSKLIVIFTFDFDSKSYHPIDDNKFLSDFEQPITRDCHSNRVTEIAHFIQWKKDTKIRSNLTFNLLLI